MPTPAQRLAELEATVEQEIRQGRGQTTAAGNNNDNCGGGGDGGGSLPFPIQLLCELRDACLDCLEQRHRGTGGGLVASSVSTVTSELLDKARLLFFLNESQQQEQQQQGGSCLFSGFPPPTPRQLARLDVVLHGAHERTRGSGFIIQQLQQDRTGGGRSSTTGEEPDFSPRLKSTPRTIRRDIGGDDDEEGEGEPPMRVVVPLFRTNRQRRRGKKQKQPHGDQKLEKQHEEQHQEQEGEKNSDARAPVESEEAGSTLSTKAPRNEKNMAEVVPRPPKQQRPEQQKQPHHGGAIRRNYYFSRGTTKKGDGKEAAKGNCDEVSNNKLAEQQVVNGEGRSADSVAEDTTVKKSTTAATITPTKACVHGTRRATPPSSSPPASQAAKRSPLTVQPPARRAGQTFRERRKEAEKAAAAAAKRHADEDLKRAQMIQQQLHQASRVLAQRRIVEFCRRQIHWKLHFNRLRERRNRRNAAALYLKTIGRAYMARKAVRNYRFLCGMASKIQRILRIFVSKLRKVCAQSKIRKYLSEEHRKERAVENNLYNACKIRQAKQRLRQRSEAFQQYNDARIEKEHGELTSLEISLLEERLAFVERRMQARTDAAGFTDLHSRAKEEAAEEEAQQLEQEKETQLKHVAAMVTLISAWFRRYQLRFELDRRRAEESLSDVLKAIAAKRRKSAFRN